MELTRKKRKIVVTKPSNEVNSRRVWIRMYTIFTLLHFFALLGLSYFFRELVRGIDAPVEAAPQTQLPALEVLHSKLTTIESRMNTKSHSLLQEVKEEEVTKELVPTEPLKEVKPVR